MGQGGGVVGGGGDGDAVYAGAAESLSLGRFMAVHPFGEGGLPGGAGGIRPDELPCFGVFQGEEAHTRHFGFQRVMQVYGDDIVAAVGDEKGVLVICRFRQKIRHQKEDAAPLEDAVGGIERQFDVRAAPFGLEGEEVADEAQDVAASLAGGDESFHAVGEDEEADFVVVGGGGKSQHRRQFRRQFSLEAIDGAEVAGAAGIHQEHDGQLALFNIAFDERFAHAGGHVPINIADFVANLVRAHLIEFHAVSFEDGVVLPGEAVVHQAAGADFDAANFAEQVGGEHRVTALPRVPGCAARCHRW